MEDSLLHCCDTSTSMRNSITNSLSLSLPSSRYFLGDFTELRSGDDYDDGSTTDHAYSKPFVVLDVIWNLSFVLVSVVVLLSTLREKPSTPLRLWICGYAFQCLLHVGFLYYEYRRRNNLDHHLVSGDGDSLFEDHQSSIVKKLESLNTMLSSIWWVIGFYFVFAGGQALVQDSPHLYWLTVVFLALDVFFMVFLLGVACVICLALLCCIPVVAIAYAMTIREGASEDDIRGLPKYRFHRSYASRTPGCEIKRPSGVAVEFQNMDRFNELTLHPDDSECCICLTQYVDGAELCALPCNHHFHNGCISRWLRINATCPLCKFNILKGDSLV